MSEHGKEPPGERGDFVERWALVAFSALTSLFGSMVTLLMLGSLAAGVEWLAPLLSLVVIMSSVMGIGLSAAAIFLRKQAAWPAFVFAVLPCVCVLGVWAWSFRHAR